MLTPGISPRFIARNTPARRRTWRLLRHGRHNCAQYLGTSHRVCLSCWMTASDGCDAGVPGSVNECWFASFGNTRPPRPAPTAPCKNLLRENMVIPPGAGSRGGGGIGSAPGADGLHEWAPLPHPSAAPASTPTEEGFGWRRRGKGQTPRAPPHSAASGSRPNGGWVAQPIQDAGDVPRREVQQIESNPRIVKQ